MVGFLKAGRRGQGSQKEKKGLFQARSPFGRRVGVYHVDYLTSVDQEIPN